MTIAQPLQALHPVEAIRRPIFSDTARRSHITLVTHPRRRTRAATPVECRQAPTLQPATSRRLATCRAPWTLGVRRRMILMLAATMAGKRRIIIQTDPPRHDTIPLTTDTDSSATARRLPPTNASDKVGTARTRVASRVTTVLPNSTPATSHPMADRQTTWIDASRLETNTGGVREVTLIIAPRWIRNDLMQTIRPRRHTRAIIPHIRAHLPTVTLRHHTHNHMHLRLDLPMAPRSRTTYQATGPASNDCIPEDDPRRNSNPHSTRKATPGNTLLQAMPTIRRGTGQERTLRPRYNRGICLVCRT